MNWTKDYPTKPGFYWLRNYTMKYWIGPDRKKPVLEPTLARVYPMLDSFLIGDECSHQREEYISAEWYGPIEPPTEPDKTVADQWVEGFGGGEFSTLEEKL